MQDTSVIEQNASTLAPPGSEPDESWSDDMLFDFGRDAVKESDRLEAQAQPLIGQSIGSRLQAGHAWSILRKRFKAEGMWSSFQKEHGQSRTTMWQMIEVYERSAEDGYTAPDLVANYRNWTGILLAYGLAQPRKGIAGGCVVEQLEAPEDDVEGDAVEDDFVEETAEGEDLEDDSDESEAELPSCEAVEIAEEEIPPVTADEIVAADAFVSAVGGVQPAARALIARCGGDKEVVKNTVTEVVQAASAVLTPPEITEIVIVGNAKGIKWVSV